MRRIESSAVVEATQLDVFDLAQDYALRLEWDPFLRSMEFLDGAIEAAVGVRVRVRARNGLGMTVEYVSLKRPERVAVEMVDGPSFLSRFAGTWAFERVDAEHTRIRFVYSFESRWPWFRRVVDPVIAAVFGRDIKKRVEGLERGVTSPALIAKLRARVT